MYTAIDDDFRKPAGEPHFASLKAVRSEGAAQLLILGVLREDFAFRVIADTQRDRVFTAQLPPLQFGQTSEATDPAAILTALDQLERRFADFQFPRPGLYAVICAYQLAFGQQRKSGDFDARTLPLPIIGRNVGRFFLHVHEGGFEASEVSHASFESFNVTFFMPAAPPTRQVKTARLRVPFIGGGPTQDIPAGFRLNGKPPIATEGVQCFAHSDIPGTIICSGIATWDFVDEVRSLAAQGGGEFIVVPEITPSLAFGIEGLHVNYPWRHGGELGALTLTFEQACPKKLVLVLMSPFVQPQSLPRRLADTQATIEARVTTCPPETGTPPQSVEVRFMVEPPIAGRAEAGGHVHNAVRPTGTFGRPGGPRETNCTVTTFDAEGMGSCSVTYHPYYLITLLHDSRQLGWIKVDGVHKSLLSKLINAKRKLEEGQSAVTKNTLNAFLNEVQAVSCTGFFCPENKPLTSEAYALLFFNGRFLIERL